MLRHVCSSEPPRVARHAGRDAPETTRAATTSAADDAACARRRCGARGASSPACCALASAPSAAPRGCDVGHTAARSSGWPPPALSTSRVGSNGDAKGARGGAHVACGAH
eukprot:4381809-Pleurochrysis_carterae.AAC.1